MATVFVGLSGGVDSAVSAALLRQQGFDVVGAFIKIWRPEFIECPWQQERLDAMRVCAGLQIPFREIDLSDEYKRTVIDDLIDGYSRGITPNPDVLCNRHIKFGSFAQWAFREGADYIATGHYAQIRRVNHVGFRKSYMLVRGEDANKDQSYFLWQLRQDDLAHTLFPIGGMTKPEVRVLAGQLNLPVARKPDSQGLCFVGDVSMADFLSRYISVAKGPVLDEAGRVIGEHDGAALYTLGERHGFRTQLVSSHDTPRYVVSIDTRSNTITTSHNKSGAFRKRVTLREVNWISTPDNAARLKAQTRYREEPIACTVSLPNTVRFEEPRLAPQGQSLVIYEGDILVGGGIVNEGVAVG